MIPYTVAELNQQLESVLGEIMPEPVAIRGTLTTWKRSKAWQRGELVTYEDNQVVAKIALGCLAKRGIAISKKLARNEQPLEPPVDITVIGVLGIHPQYGLRFHIHDIDPSTVEEADARKRKADLRLSLESNGLLHRQRTHVELGEIAKIGLITPQSGDDGRQDALDILLPLGLEINEKRILTSGPKATTSIINAIASLQTTCDIVVVVRGGCLLYTSPSPRDRG